MLKSNFSVVTANSPKSQCMSCSFVYMHKEIVFMRVPYSSNICYFTSLKYSILSRLTNWCVRHYGTADCRKLKVTRFGWPPTFVTKFRENRFTGSKVESEREGTEKDMA